MEEGGEGGGRREGGEERRDEEGREGGTGGGEREGGTGGGREEKEEREGGVGVVTEKQGHIKRFARVGRGRRDRVRLQTWLGLMTGGVRVRGCRRKNQGGMVQCFSLC